MCRYVSLTRLLAIAGFLSLVAVSLIVFNAVRIAGRAERNLHASILATAVLEAYINETNGDWPNSWDEIQAEVETVKAASMYSWPQDFDEVRKRVEIDFAADPEILARSTPESFTAIKPNGPCYAYDRDFIYLIHTLNKFHHAEE